MARSAEVQYLKICTWIVHCSRSWFLWLLWSWLSVIIIIISHYSGTTRCNKTIITLVLLLSPNMVVACSLHYFDVNQQIKKGYKTTLTLLLRELYSCGEYSNEHTNITGKEITCNRIWENQPVTRKSIIAYTQQQSSEQEDVKWK